MIDFIRKVQYLFRKLRQIKIQFKQPNNIKNDKNDKNIKDNKYS